ncbi:hypothetical protein [Natrinema gelatinilyticum]|uniref:hypothetical protein n=1 Tax=Natrinema gelatinilyticum TaxID=2961571 RepID=UPI0020C56E3D|nr:hypothetical protein [Natrinema gelatinilyticum]
MTYSSPYDVPGEKKLEHQNPRAWFADAIPREALREPPRGHVARDATRLVSERLGLADLAERRSA